MVKILRSFLFAVPILYPLFNSMWLGSTELFIVQAAYAVAVILFEIPTWFFGDKYSRKTSLIIGSIFLGIWYFMYFQSSWLWWFVIAEVMIAFGASFQSGSDTAMIYDSLAQVGKEGTYKKVSWVYNSLARFSEAAWAIIAWLVATHFLKLPFLMDVACHVIALLFLVTLIEPPIERFDQKESSLSQLKQVYRYIMHGHQYILWLLILGAVLSSISLVMVWMLQPYMQEVWLTLAYIGIARAIYNVLTWVFHIIAHKYEARLGIKKTLLSLIWIRAAWILLAWFLSNVWWLLCFVVIAFTRACQRTVTEDILHTAVVSKMRATVSSVQSMFFRFWFVILGPVIGRVVDEYSLKTALYIFWVFSLLSSLYAFYQFWGKYTSAPIVEEII